MEKMAGRSFEFMVEELEKQRVAAKALPSGVRPAPRPRVAVDRCCGFGSRQISDQEYKFLAFLASLSEPVVNRSWRRG